MGACIMFTPASFAGYSDYRAKHGGDVANGRSRSVSQRRIQHSGSLGSVNKRASDSAGGGRLSRGAEVAPEQRRSGSVPAQPRGRRCATQSSCQLPRVASCCTLAQLMRGHADVPDMDRTVACTAEHCTCKRITPLEFHEVSANEMCAALLRRACRAPSRAPRRRAPSQGSSCLHRGSWI